MGEYIIKVSASDYASAVTFADYYDLYYLIELNRISEFRFIAFGLSAAQKAVLIEGNTVYILYDSTLVLKGEIRKADIDDELEEYHIEGNGMAITLLDRDVRGRNLWDDTEADTIVKSLISGIMTEGTIEAAIKVGFRAEEDSVLRGGVSLTKAIDWDWYVDQDVTFNTDRFNFVANKGATTSQETFILGDDIFRIQRSKDVDNVFNVVRVLGYGDGVNQIMSESFYATTNRATLSAAITAAAASLTVTEDISSFPASGNLRCGREWIVYSAKNDGTKTFTISARGNIPGANPPSDNPYYIAAYAHKKGAEIFDLQYSDAGFATKATAQAGTSIKTYGLRDNLYPDQAIRNQTTVDLLAQRLVNKYNVPVERIELSTAEEVLTAAIGDIVSIEERDDYTITGINQGTKTFTIAGDYASEFTDTYDAFRVSGSTGNDGRYTIVSGTFDTDHTDIVVSEAIPDATVDGTINPHVEYRLLKEEFNYEDYSMSLVLGNAQDFFLEAFGELKKKMDINSVYGLGNTCLYSVQSYENCDASHPLHLRFFLPPELVAINHVYLSFKIKQYRAYTGTTPSGGGSTTPAGGGHTTPSGGGSTSGASSASTTGGSASTSYYGAIVATRSTKDVASHTHTHSRGNHKHYITIQDYSIDFNVGLHIGVHGFVVSGQAGDYASTKTDGSGNTGNDSGGEVVSHVTCDGWGQWVHKDHTHGMDHTHTTPAHTHTVSTHTHTTPAHTHIMTYQIHEASESGPSITVKVGEDGAGLTEITGSPFASDQQKLDIADLIRAIGIDKWIDVEFTPNQIRRIEANVYLQVFIESK